MQAIIFDDGHSPLAPLTDLRPAFDVRTGALTTLERLVRVLDLDVASLIVPDALAPLTREIHAEPLNEWPDSEEPILLVNARCVIPPAGLAHLTINQLLAEERTGDIIGACLHPSAAAALLAGKADPAIERLTQTPQALLHRPWDVIRLRDQAMAMDLKLLAGDEALRIDPTATVHESAILDTQSGPVVIGPHATVRPGAIITGPAYVGERSVVLDRALIRSNTAIGPTCKVAGEVSGAIFQGFANKAHDGFLGDSWVGQWVNLGAGTTTSNLLNTYAEVAACADVTLGNERTGMQYLGAIVGDHTKTAICTRIMTGAVIHTGVMWAAGNPITGCIERFSWVTDAGTQRYHMHRFLDTATAMMARRGVAMGEAYRARLEHLEEARA